MGLPKEIADLIERFDRNRESYRSGQYNETQLKREFLDPFFSVLGWDVENKQGYAEAYEDVIHEDALRSAAEQIEPYQLDIHDGYLLMWYNRHLKIGHLGNYF